MALETIALKLVSNLPLAVIAGISAGVLRNIAGWVENAWKDGKVDDYEWKQLAGTIVKYFSSIALLSLGLDVGTATAVTFGLDVGTSAIKNAAGK